MNASGGIFKMKVVLWRETGNADGAMVAWSFVKEQAVSHSHRTVPACERAVRFPSCGSIPQLPAFGRWPAASDSIRLFARASNSSNPTRFACTIKRLGADPM